jgi:hypothetical protein
MQTIWSITIINVGNASTNQLVNKVCLSPSFCIFLYFYSTCGIRTLFLQPPTHLSNGNAILGSMYSSLWLKSSGPNLKPHTFPECRFSHNYRNFFQLHFFPIIWMVLIPIKYVSFHLNFLGFVSFFGLSTFQLLVAQRSLSLTCKHSSFQCVFILKLAITIIITIIILWLLLFNI